MLNIAKSKISIIVPVYNVEKYLKKCVSSIINQTYKNLEIILIDDGSTDNSGKICDELAQKDERIIVIHKENEGVSATKNLGMQISTGEYVGFIDSDDYIANDYIADLYNNMIETDSDVSIVGYNVVNEADMIMSSSVENNGFQADEIVVYEEENIIKELLKQKTIKNFVCKIYKKSVLCDFEIGVTYEDIVFSLKVLKKAKRVVYINKNSYNYLKRTDSITATISEKNLMDFANAILARYEIVRKEYEELSMYNIYAFLESTLALSLKYIITERKFEKVNDMVKKFVETINEYSEKHEAELIEILNNYQKICIYLMKYNVELYYNFIEENYKLKKR